MSPPCPPPETARTQRAAVFALMLSGLFWGTTWIPLKHFARSGLSGLGVTLLSYGAVGVVSLPWIWRERARWRSQTGLFLGAALAGGAANVCFASGLMLGQVVRVMLLFYLTPVWAVIGARLFLREPIFWQRALGVGIAVTGAGLVLGGPRVIAAPLSLPDVLGLGSGLFYAMQNVAFRAAHRVPVLSKTLSVFAASAALSGLLLGLGGSGIPAVTPVLLFELVAFAALWIGGAMWTTMYGVSHLEAGRAAVLLVFELVVSVISAMLVGGERLNALEWMGAALIVGAALAEARAGSAAPAA